MIPHLSHLAVHSLIGSGDVGCEITYHPTPDATPSLCATPNRICMQEGAYIYTTVRRNTLKEHFLKKDGSTECQHVNRWVREV